MEHFSNINPADDSTNIISWHLLTVCQYHCPYCYARKEMPWGKMASKLEVDHFANELENVRVNFQVELVGGEPTLHPLICYVVNRLERIENCSSILLYTNLHKFLLFKGKVRYRVSWHPDVSKPIVLDNIERLNREGITPDIIVMMPPNNPVPGEILSRLKKCGNVEYNYVSVGDSIKPNIGYAYNDLGDGYLLNGKLISSVDANNMSFRGWRCRASRIDVDVEGNIYEACRYTGKNVYSSAWLANWLPREITCENGRCPACLLQLPKHLDHL